MTTQIIRNTEGVIRVGKFCAYNGRLEVAGFTPKPIVNQKIYINGEINVNSAIFDYLLINGVLRTTDNADGIKASKIANYGSVEITNKELDIETLYSTGGIDLINCSGRIKNLQCSGSILIEGNSNLVIENLLNSGGTQISGNTKIINARSNSLTLSGTARIEKLTSLSNLQVTESAFVKSVSVVYGGFTWTSDYINESANFILESGGGFYESRMPNVEIIAKDFGLTISNSTIDTVKLTGESTVQITTGTVITELLSDAPIVIYNNSTNLIKSGTLRELTIEDGETNDPFDDSHLTVNENYNIGELPSIDQVEITVQIKEFDEELEFYNS